MGPTGGCPGRKDRCRPWSSLQRRIERASDGRWYHEEMMFFRSIAVFCPLVCLLAQTPAPKPTAPKPASPKPAASKPATAQPATSPSAAPAVKLSAEPPQAATVPPISSLPPDKVVITV